MLTCVSLPLLTPSIGDELRFVAIGSQMRSYGIVTSNVQSVLSLVEGEDGMSSSSNPMKSVAFITGQGNTAHSRLTQGQGFQLERPGPIFELTSPGTSLLRF